MHQFTKIFLIICVLCNFIYLSNANGAIVTASSCSCSDIQTAINSASSDDTVSVPAGTCTWTTASCGSGISVTKPLTLIGSGIGNTTIIINTTFAYPIGVGYTSNVNSFSRISGFTLQPGAISGSNGTVVSVNLSGTGNNQARLDHLSFASGFAGFGQRCLMMHNGNGVIDHNQFNDCEILIFPTSWDTEWTKSISLGSYDEWYFEDNVFAQTQGYDLLDCMYGGRYTARYNTFTASGGAGAAWVANHGYDSVYRGCMIQEVYNNTFTNNTSGNLSWAIEYRGGTGVIFNNTITGLYNYPIGITNYRSCSGFAGLEVGYCTGGANDGQGCYSVGDCPSGTCTQNLCDGTGRFDGNTQGQYGYPCRDQIGRGGNQVLMPIYEWNNTLNGSAVHIQLFDSYVPCSYQDTDHILANRDYYNSTQMPGYVPYTYPHPLQGSLTPPQNLRLVQ